MSDAAAWFVDGAYLFKVWQGLQRSDRLDYLKLRNYLETTFQAQIDDAYYFSADPDPRALASMPFTTRSLTRRPTGPGCA